MALKLFTRGKSKSSKKPRQGHGRRDAGNGASSDSTFEPAPREALDSDPLKCVLWQERYSSILRDEETWRKHPGADQAIAQAKAQLEQRMALVPAGSVVISQTLNVQTDSNEEEIDVDPFLLDIHSVTNSRFQKFVDAGGYDALEFWPEEIWPHLIELKDLTDQPAPRFWRNGRHDINITDHPVVGISWYEAQAYALWIGQRLPVEAEWQMAASWHINSSTNMMRRFPWGDAMDNTRCNIWSSRRRGTVEVDEYANGSAPNQVRQLAGNVWEWTDSDYSIVDEQQRPVVGEMPMHAIRGGAFDTYFENQATNYFRTGQIALARSYDTGFRCAMDLSEASWINGD